MTKHTAEATAQSALADAMGIGPDKLVCVVGAGGIKPFLYRLTTELNGVLTSTVGIPAFDDEVAAVVVSEDPVEAIQRQTTRPLGVVPARRDSGRYRGYDPATVERLGRLIDGVTVVKSDGARSRLLKAPADHEPQLPATTDIVCPLASVKVVGRPLNDEHVHRPERVASVTGCSPGEALSAWDVATVVVSTDGSLKHVPSGARVVPILTMVETAADESTAAEIAEWVREHPKVDRVVTVRLDHANPVVDVY